MVLELLPRRAVDYGVMSRRSRLVDGFVVWATTYGMVRALGKPFIVVRVSSCLEWLRRRSPPHRLTLVRGRFVGDILGPFISILRYRLEGTWKGFHSRAQSHGTVLIYFGQGCVTAGESVPDVVAHGRLGGGQPGGNVYVGSVVAGSARSRMMVLMVIGVNEGQSWKGWNRPLFITPALSVWWWNTTEN